jgi:hypothetical protein
MLSRKSNALLMYHRHEFLDLNAVNSLAYTASKSRIIVNN